MIQSTFLSEEPRARISPSPDSARDWMATVATSRSNFSDLLAACGPGGLSGKMSLRGGTF